MINVDCYDGPDGLRVRGLEREQDISVCSLCVRIPVCVCVGVYVCPCGGVYIRDMFGMC